MCVSRRHPFIIMSERVLENVCSTYPLLASRCEGGKRAGTVPAGDEVWVFSVHAFSPSVDTSFFLQAPDAGDAPGGKAEESLCLQ